MDLQLPSLDALGHKFGTDKASGSHDYLSFYETLLQEGRHREVRVLEIGVQFGSSLRMWEEYFPNGIIIGADIHPGVKTFTGERIRTEIVDQSNLEDLVRLGTEHGPFDLVVEDGSHMWGHQIDTLRTLFPFVKSPGLFIVEDLHTNYGSLVPTFKGVSRISCMDYLKELVDRKVADEQINIADDEDPFLRTYGRSMEFVTFLKRACIIKKHYRLNLENFYPPGAEAPEAASAPLIERSYAQQAKEISIACHIGMIGDWYSNSGSIRSLQDNEGIQGFIVYSEQLPGNALEYRARLADGRWTEWVNCGSFVGTMGVAQGLRGFSARLTGDAAGEFTLDVIGLFRGNDDPVRAAGGEDCVSDSTADSLYGIQINLMRG